MITIVIAAFIIVPLRRILCGPNNNWEASGTDMPNMHKGDTDGDGGNGDDGGDDGSGDGDAGDGDDGDRTILAFPSVAPTGKPGSSINSRARELAVTRSSLNVTVSIVIIVLSIVRIIVQNFIILVAPSSLLSL